ncbi:MAG: hypothetical protein DYG93_10785 [Leptolyngbya sp. PLA2]|nr:hypothetical protein [Leptolyngbya sp.]MCE7972130.1 hypothetical protein [Leptolyngbya sp. PL-A2]MCQ3941513.1 hypothetical protein [cyanobacterium CYA1]
MFACCAAGVLAASCASRPVDPARTASAPPDFTLSVTVLSSARSIAETDRLPPRSRPACYLVEPDGSFRVAVGPAASPKVFPPLARTLTREQVDRVWSLARDAGVLDADHPGRVQNVETFVRPAGNATVALVYAGFAGSQRHVAVALDGDHAEPAALVPLIDELNALAWMRAWSADGTP